MSKTDYFKKTPGLLDNFDQKKLAQLVGEIMQLWITADTHRNNSLLEFERAVFLPIHHNQFRIYHENNRPVGFVSWAYLTPELGDKYISGNFDFKPEYWNIGKQLWFIDFIAPYGDTGKIANDLKTNIFPNEIAYAPLFNKNAKRYKKIKLYGVNRRSENDNEE